MGINLFFSYLIPEVMHDLEHFLFVNFQRNNVIDGNFDLPIKKAINFFPPLYRQRYSFVNDLVNQHKPKKVGICFQTFN